MERKNPKLNALLSGINNFINVRETLVKHRDGYNLIIIFEHINVTKPTNTYLNKIIIELIQPWMDENKLSYVSTNVKKFSLEEEIVESDNDESRYHLILSAELKEG